MKELFKNLGLDEKETLVFLRLLELGAQPVSVIAKNTQIPRSSMYLILDRLKNIGLVEQFERGGIIYVKCIAPKEIANILDAGKNKIEKTQNLLRKALPELSALENKLSITPQVRFFEGKNAVMKMYDEVLKEKDFYAFFNPQLVKKFMPEYHYEIPETLKKNKGSAKELLVDCEEAREYKKRYNSKNHRIKILHKTADFASDTIICRDKIYMISYGEKQVSATEIINTSLADSHRVIFEQLWNLI